MTYCLFILKVKNIVSSAKRLVLTKGEDDMSFMYIANKRGERHEPCGTPEYM